MNTVTRRKTPSVKIGNILIGSKHPVAIQSMTDTPTADIAATVAQTQELIAAGSELVRWTINDAKAAQAVPEIIKILKDQNIENPIIGDFHFNGHVLLKQFPKTAQALAKYRINPGNIGRGKKHDGNFATFIRIAKEYAKPVRIGVNGGSLDDEIFTQLMAANSRRSKPLSFSQVTCQAMIESALRSADYALKLGLKSSQIVLSAKMSTVSDMVTVYEALAKKCEFALHLGLTEAGADLAGVTASSVALGILLNQGIGDTIRISLTPQPQNPRTREVEACQNVLQALGLRYFAPTITSCPGCGRTNPDFFQSLTAQIRRHVQEQTPLWRKTFPGVENLKIAVMGCVVNGPGESQHADIGISLPGASEKMQAPVYVGGKKITVLSGSTIVTDFFKILEDYIQEKFS